MPPPSPRRPLVPPPAENIDDNDDDDNDDDENMGNDEIRIPTLPLKSCQAQTSPAVTRSKTGARPAAPKKSPLKNFCVIFVLLELLIDII